MQHRLLAGAFAVGGVFTQTHYSQHHHGEWDAEQPPTFTNHTIRDALLPSKPPLSTSIVCVPTQTNSSIIEGMPLLKEYTPWCESKHAQIVVWLCREKVYMKLQSKVPLHTHRQLLTHKDGATTALDWFKPIDQEKRQDACAETVAQPLPADAPVVMFCHSINGSGEQFKMAAHHLHNKHGFRCVSHVRRGHGGLLMTSGEFSTMGVLGDTEDAIKEIKRQYPAAPLLLVGMSAGTAPVAHYLGRQTTEEGGAVAGVLISPGYDISQCFSRFEWPYDRIVLRSLGKFLKRHAYALKPDTHTNTNTHANDPKHTQEAKDDAKHPLTHRARLLFTNTFLTNRPPIVQHMRTLFTRATHAEAQCEQTASTYTNTHHTPTLMHRLATAAATARGVGVVGLSGRYTSSARVSAGDEPSAAPAHTHPTAQQRAYVYSRLGRFSCLQEFHDALHGFAGDASAREFYGRANPMHVVRNIQVPFLAINAVDDPCTTANNIDYALFRENPNAILAVTPHGSHCCFLQKKQRTNTDTHTHTSVFGATWVEEVVGVYFERILEMKGYRAKKN